MGIIIDEAHAVENGNISFSFSTSSDALVEGKQYEIIVTVTNSTGSAISNYSIKLYNQYDNNNMALLYETSPSGSLKNGGSKSITYGVWTAQKNLRLIAELWLNNSNSADYISDPFAPNIVSKTPENILYLDDSFKVNISGNTNTLYMQAFRFTENVLDSYYVNKNDDKTRDIEIVLNSNTASDAAINLWMEYAKPSSVNRIGFKLNENKSPISTAKATVINLTNGEASCVIGVYDSPSLIIGTKNGVNFLGCVLTYNMHFKIGEPSVADDPNPKDVTNIKIITPPYKTQYYAGEEFAPNGMVVEATLVNSEKKNVAGYNYLPKEKLKLGDSAVTVFYGSSSVKQNIRVIPKIELCNVSISNGWMINENLVMTEKGLETRDNLFRAITHCGDECGVFSFSVSDNTDVLINGVKQTVEEGVCTIRIPSSDVFDTDMRKEIDGAKTIVTLSGAGEYSDIQKEYIFQCSKQLYSDMPSNVIDYLCIGSQYTNKFPYGINAIATLRGQNPDTTTSTITTAPTSIGNFGGYITYYYENAITNKSNNPYGVDFLIHGNSVDGTDEFAEPGQVWVSEDGIDWYALAGSIHYDDIAIWDYTMTYKKNKTWEDNKGNTGTIRYEFPEKNSYNLYNWPSTENVAEIAVSGIYLTPKGGINAFGNTLPQYPAFGYVDVHNLGNTNIASNPYVEGGTYYDVFDLAWAVDAQGQPVDVSDKEFHYVKIQTASFIENGAIGEKSTEINMMRIAQPAAEDVGKTATPTNITIDGKTATPTNLASGGSAAPVYDMSVSGPFIVEVDAPEGANVYINGERTSSRKYDAIPDHKIIRVIVQEGEKAPWIAYYNLSEGEAAETVTLRFNDGGSVTTGVYDKQMDGCALPVPAASAGKEFLGWQLGQKLYTEFSFRAMPDGAELTAVWNVTSTAPAHSENNITVKFRLIGCSEAEDDINLADGNYHGAEYQTWIATRDYTIPDDYLVIDLIQLALSRAGLEARNPSGNYIESIFAPESLGGQEMEEFTNGPRSGWMYTIGRNADGSDGYHANNGVAQQKLTDGDVVIFHYVNDYAYEVADWDRLGGVGYPAQGDGTYHNKWLEAEDVNPPSGSRPGGETGEKKDEDKDKDKPAETPAAEKVVETVKVEAKADAKGVAAAKVEAKAVADAVKNAAEKKADSIVIKPEVTGDAKEVKVELPKASVSEIAKSSVALVVETDKGSVEVPNEILKEIAEQAGGANVEISVADKSVEDAGVKAAIADKLGDDANTDNAAVAEITVTSGDKKITTFSGKMINASVSVDGKKGFAEGKKYLTLVISENGKRELLAGKCSKGADGKLNVGVKVGHLSTFVVLDKELKSFTDAEAHWSADAVDFAVANGLMNGVSDKAFAPNSTLNRAMLVTILYRLAGSPAVADAAKFADVAAGQWYSDAVAWAAANGIVTGKTETAFAPNDNITREQFATMLMRYCKFAGLDTAKNADLGAFTDSASISAYAKDALAWANASGIITGRTATTIAPNGSATRGEAATMLMRFMQM